MSILQTFKDIRRLRQITNVLFKHGMGYFIEQVQLKPYLHIHKRVLVEKFEKPEAIPVRLRKAMEELEGSFVKLGQTLSIRPDLIPEEYCEEFAKLQDNVKPIPFDTVKQIIVEEFKKPLADIFQSIEPAPVAAASVGQVHMAVLKSGEVVAVKVQRPNIKRVFKTDIDLLYHLAGLAEKYIPEIRNYNPSGIVRQFEGYTNDELDYMVEAQNIDVFHKQFENNPNVKIPKVYWDYTTSRVLTMEYIKGAKLKDLKTKFDFSSRLSIKEKVIDNINNSIATQILEFGFFHADPHPGNILVLTKNRIAFLDFGIIGRISEEMRENMEDILIAMLQKDPHLLTDTLVDIGIIGDDVDVDSFEEDLLAHFAKYYEMTLERINPQTVFYDTFSIGRKYNIQFPVNFVLLAKSLATVYGVNRQYYADYNFVEGTRSVVEKILRRRSSPAYIANAVKKNVYDLKRAFKRIPTNARGVLNLIKKGAHVKIEVDNRDIKRFTRELDRSSNRLTFGIIIASLVVATFLSISTNLEPFFWGIPKLGFATLSLAVMFTLAMLYSISKEPKGGVEE